MASRNGIDQKEIASILRDVAAYVQSRNVGPAHQKLAAAWLQAEKPSPAELTRFETLLKAYESCDRNDAGGRQAAWQQMTDEESRLLKRYGYPNIIESIGDDAFGYFLKQDPEDGRCRDPQDYWPGKLIPSLIEMQDLLRFCAYREKIEEKDGEAQRLVDGIESFKGFYGSCHCAGTSILHEQSAFIDATERHPSEVYTPPREDLVSESNSVHFAFNWLENRWLPAGEGLVEARLSMSGNGRSNHTKYDELARYRVSIAEGLRRGRIQADVTVELGKTYGEDSIVVKMGTEDYARYVAIKCGREEIDLSRKEQKNPWDEIEGPDIAETYAGYEPGKQAFYGPDGVYIADDLVRFMGANLAAGKNIEAEAERSIAFFLSPLGERLARSVDLDWLRQTGFVEERPVTLQTGEAQNFTRFIVKPIPWGRENVFVVDGEELDSCALHNGINSRLRQIVNGLNRKEPLREVRKRPTARGGSLDGGPRG